MNLSARLACFILVVSIGACFVVSSTNAKVREVTSGLSPWREPTDTATLDPTRDIERIRFLALQFYNPPRDQSRRLDRQLLSETANDTGQDSLTATEASRLIAKLGQSGGFCLAEAPEACRPSTYAAVLRVSRVYATDLSHARVVVGYSALQGGVVTKQPSQVFLMERIRGVWKLTTRQSVDAP